MKWTPLAAILAITIIECVALLKGVDGLLFSLAVAAISGLGGFQVKSVLDKIKGGK